MTADFKTIWWVRSLASDVAEYRVEQQKDGGAWTVVATVPAIAGRWTYQQITDQLVDLASYAWRVVPVDTAGTDGTPIVIPAERVVRTPDAPDFTVSYDAGTQRVTFSE